MKCKLIIGCSHDIYIFKNKKDGLKVHKALYGANYEPDEYSDVKRLELHCKSNNYNELTRKIYNMCEVCIEGD